MIMIGKYFKTSDVMLMDFNSSCKCSSNNSSLN